MATTEPGPADLREVLVDGLHFPEGPCWTQDGALIFVDLAARAVSVLDEAGIRIVARSDGAPNGAALSPQGVLHVADNGGHWPATASTSSTAGPGGRRGRILQVCPGGDLRVVLEEIDGIPLDAPNDICFDALGGYYVTDPHWGDDGQAAHHGAVCYQPPDGPAVRSATGLLFPNGVCVSTDQSTLLVSETRTGRVLAADILAPGRLGAWRTYAELGPDISPDGMCLDADGRLLVAGSTAGAVFVVLPGGGPVERVLRCADPVVTNVCFGGPDLRTLYVTEASLGRITTVRWDVPGAPLPMKVRHL
ncbi:SMP-30/gluconolactonase/LRE family protein [Phytohabitans kaempferiae]|uniref:SMP-30/gluconolactonase/LRE family protein n=1 Tax=Phytohabitans kaempferiae TaxID=1620943 RepID=A0ABV6MA42_9ACTN